MGYLAKSGCHYVKAIDGQPVFRSTQTRSEAARFHTAEAAREWAPKVFRGSMLDGLEIVAEPIAQSSTGPVRLSKADRFNDEPNFPGDHYMGR